MQIIELLTADGRVSNRAISKRVGLTEATVAARIRNLSDRHVLGISTVFDWVAAGFTWDLWLAIEVEGRSVVDVANDIAARDDVHAVLIVFGAADIFVHMLMHDRKTVIASLANGIRGIKGVHNIVADVSLETLKYAVNFARLPVASSKPVFPAPVVPLDDLDMAIVAALLADGRQSNREIARQLGVSDGTVRVRLRRMHDAGLLRICGQTDPYLTGRIGAWAFVGVDVAGSRVRRLTELLAAMPEVLILTMTSGVHDLLLFVVAPTRNALEDVVLRQIRALSGVRKTTTSEVIRTIKFDFKWGRLL